MDSDSIRAASTYLNNLLLARGLQPSASTSQIDFYKPSRENRAQIINLVHDLILRSDRDAAARETSAATLRNLRTENARLTADLERVGAKSEEFARGAVSAKAAEAAARNEVKKVERGLKEARELAQKLKVQVGQVRQQCANDVRKRDKELERLKGHLQDGRRGARGAGGAPGLTIVGAGVADGVGGQGRRGFERSGRAAVGTEDPAYNLRQETTEFLTQLSQSLSDENDGLIGLIREALGTLRQLLGQTAWPDSAIGSRGSEDYGQGDGSETGMLQAMPASYATLSSELTATLAQLKTILTNPNFVPISEVEAREDEIAHLREGWERMEQRWRDVLMMMEGWRRKMDGGATINLDDLTKGMNFASPGRDGNDHKMFRASKRRSIEQSVLEDSILGEQQQEEQEDVSEMPSPPHVGNTVPEVANPSPQQPALGNIFSPIAKPRKSTTPTKRKRSVLDPPETFDLRPSITASAARSPAHRSAGQSSPQRPQARSERSVDPRSVRSTRSTRPPARAQRAEHSQLEREEDAAENQDVHNGSGGEAPETFETSELIAPELTTYDGTDDSAEDRAHLTIAEKLAQAAAEAEAAASAFSPVKVRSSPNRTTHVPESPSHDAENLDPSDVAVKERFEEDDDTLGLLPPPPPSAVKRTGVRGTARRRKRKSTLSPEELGELLGME